MIIIEEFSKSYSQLVSLKINWVISYGLQDEIVLK